MVSGADCQLPHPSHLDDEITALTIQRDEIRHYDGTRKGKRSANHVSDLESAYKDHLAEIEERLLFLTDAKLAHSMASAVDTDAEAIIAITAVEIQE